MTKVQARLDTNSAAECATRTHRLPLNRGRVLRWVPMSDRMRELYLGIRRERIGKRTVVAPLSLYFHRSGGQAAFQPPAPTDGVYGRLESTQTGGNTGKEGWVYCLLAESRNAVGVSRWCS